jgi:signal transduction histidine kinase
MENFDMTVFYIILTSTLVFLSVILTLLIFIWNDKRIKERESAMMLAEKESKLTIMRAVADTQEKERNKIARNLHDQIHPLLYALRMRIELDQKNKSVRPQKVENQASILQICDNLREDLINITRNLSSHLLPRFGLAGALENYLNNLSLKKLSYHAGNISQHDIPHEIAIHVYRIVLEVIQNLLCHDNIELLDVALNVEGAILKVHIAHDKQGISNEDFQFYLTTSNGLGLISIEARKKLLNGQIDFHQQPRSGLRIQVPLTDDCLSLS